MMGYKAVSTKNIPQINQSLGTDLMLIANHLRLKYKANISSQLF